MDERELAARARRQYLDICDGDWLRWLRWQLAEKQGSAARRLRHAASWAEVLRLQAALAAYEELAACLAVEIETIKEEEQA